MVSALFALSFLMPTILTISNSFMTQSEINANYGSVFSAASSGHIHIKLMFLLSNTRYLRQILLEHEYLPDTFTCKGTKSFLFFT